jgi:hypothetical protein
MILVKYNSLACSKVDTSIANGRFLKLAQQFIECRSPSGQVKVVCFPAEKIENNHQGSVKLFFFEDKIKKRSFGSSIFVSPV